MPNGVKDSGGLVTEKLCRPCGTVKPVADFYVKRRYPDGKPKVFDHPCKRCQSERNKSYYGSNSAVISSRSNKNHHDNFGRYLERKYGITLNQYDDMYARQNGQCAICFSDHPRRGDGRLSVDHCHDTGNVRGLLCRACNRGIGMLKDSPVFVQNALTYLVGGEL